MTKFAKWLMAVAVLAGSSALFHSQVTPAQTRGGLLYSTHCVTYHTTQMHWRNDKQAFDWDSLKFQVRRWQSNAGLGWNEADITDPCANPIAPSCVEAHVVARYSTGIRVDTVV